MNRGDISAAAEAIVRGGWGDRRAFLDFIVGRPFCHAFVAEMDGEIVGTGMGTVNGAVGWVGLVFVSPDARGTGLGRALTEAAIGALEEAGCRTLLLVATAMARPLYERLGFEPDAHYLTFRSPGPVADDPDPAIRELTVADAGAMIAIDTAATGEDRAQVISAALAGGTGWGLFDQSGGLLGHVVRPAWGNGSTMVKDAAAAMRLLHHRRRLAGRDHELICGIVDVNEEGRRLLEAAGWTHARSHPRLVRGQPLDWQPASIWGQFNFALG